VLPQEEGEKKKGSERRRVLAFTRVGCLEGECGIYSSLLNCPAQKRAIATALEKGGEGKERLERLFGAGLLFRLEEKTGKTSYRSFRRGREKKEGKGAKRIDR